MDLKDTDPKGWKEDSFTRVDNPSDAIIWEVNVRDFSSSETSGVSEKNRGKYLAFTESNTILNGEQSDIATCVAYLKELGVNYVQIDPINDFGTIDESGPLDNQYDWGDDPKNYNAPEGSYASDPYDGRVRIKECKQMIQALHNAGIGVIMDVVYSHTGESDKSFFNRLAPSYYYRIDEMGKWSNSSGYGNDVASERYMAGKFIRDSVSYWAKEYHIDGFCFDRMGLMDVDTVNGIRAALNKLPDGGKIIMYGEGQVLETVVSSSVLLANQNNVTLLSKGVGVYNNTGRAAAAGTAGGNDKGFVQGNVTDHVLRGIRRMIGGGANDQATIPSQCVNYVSSHDSLTLYDKLTNSVYDDYKYDKHRESLTAMNRLSAALIMMSRGVPFMFSGEELGRTKLGDQNSYRSSLEINQINWMSRYGFTTLTDYYKGLIAIRRAIPALRDPTSNNSSFTKLKTDTENTVAYALAGSGSPTIVMAFNSSESDAAKVTLPSGDWVVVADKDFAGLTALDTVKGTISVPACSAMILVDAESFPQIEMENPYCVVYLRYKDKSNDNEIICEEKLIGDKGVAYVAQTPSDVLFKYDIRSQSALNGTFDQKFKIIDVECKKYEGDFSTVTIKYLDYDEKPVANTVVMTNRVGQQYYTPSLPGFTEYALDLDNLPDNGAGLFTEKPIEVVYHYKPNEREVAKDAKYTCPANIIYLADDGKILDKKSYMGVEGDAIEIDYPEFDGYKYYDISEKDAVFTENEVNIIVCYQSPQKAFALFVKNHLIAIILGGVGVIALIVGAVLLIRRISRRRMMQSISIDG